MTHPEWAEAYAGRPELPARLDPDSIHYAGYAVYPAVTTIPKPGCGCVLCRNARDAAAPRTPDPRPWAWDGATTVLLMLALAFLGGMALGVWGVVVWTW